MQPMPQLICLYVCAYVYLDPSATSPARGDKSINTVTLSQGKFSLLKVKANLILNLNLDVYFSTERVLSILLRQQHKVWNAEVCHVVVHAFKDYSDCNIYHSGIICAMGKPYSIQKEATPQAISCVHFLCVWSSSYHSLRAISSFPAISAPGGILEILVR